MSLATALIAELRNRGIRIEYRGPGQLVLAGDTENANDTVMAAVRLAKPQLLELLAPPDPTLRADKPTACNGVRCVHCEPPIAITPDDFAAAKSDRGCQYRRATA